MQNDWFKNVHGSEINFTFLWHFNGSLYKFFLFFHIFDFLSRHLILWIRFKQYIGCQICVTWHMSWIPLFLNALKEERLEIWRFRKTQQKFFFFDFYFSFLFRILIVLWMQIADVCTKHLRTSSVDNSYDTYRKTMKEIW